MVVSLIFICFPPFKFGALAALYVSLGPALRDCFLISDGSQEYPQHQLGMKKHSPRDLSNVRVYGIESLALLYSRPRPGRSPGILPRCPWPRGSQRRQA